MAEWKYHVKIKHLMTESESLEDVKASMKAIADELDKHKCFRDFPVNELRKLKYPGSALVSPTSIANAALSRMYDYADSHKIWIE